MPESDQLPGDSAKRASSGTSTIPDKAPELRFVPRDRPTGADRVFLTAARVAGVWVMVLLALVGIFLCYRAWPAIQQRGIGFFLTDQWRVDLQPPVFGVLGLLWGTITVALIAMVFAIPVSITTALFISEWAPARLRGTLVSLVDLLAAIPSLLYGLWGYLFLEPKILPLSQWLSENVSWLPIFKVTNDNFLGSYFTAGVVVSLMVLPITTSVAREAFSQAPQSEKEAAFALGSTQWGMVRSVVLPFGKGGVIGGCMLGFGRALGETVAVTLILGQTIKTSWHILENGGATISGFIVHQFGGGGLELSALLYAGLVLFAFTLAANSVAAVIVSRSRSGAGVET
ncbi:phosphate ABC transporter permease subunit PstC [Fodinicola feengrottensis]|uniref:Phosphate transport system permease protein n=1 Tax=Fodinicola feengrottensis TaxID=435914 RepID=A0ABP4U5U6_9ACTN